MYIKGMKLSLTMILINYYCIKILTGNLLPNCTIICFGVMLICLFMDIIGNQKGKIIFGREFRCWGSYFIICLLSAAFYINTSHIIRDLIDYMQRMVIAYAVFYICCVEKSIKWSLNMLSIVAIGAAVSILSGTSDISRRLGSAGSASETISTNDIGALMVFGCFAILFAFHKRKIISIFRCVIVTAISVLFITVISISGSRKAIIALMILYILLVFFCTKSVFKNVSSVKWLLLTAAVSGVLFLAYTKLFPLFENTSLYLRLFGSKAAAASQSNDGRMQLIIQALKDFGNHPLMGLGYNNFVYYHGNYTHCTYVEPLASSGIFGLLYLYPYVCILRKQLFLYRYSQEDKIFQKALLAFYISFLFIGVGIPFIYKDIPNVMLGILLGAQEIGLDKLRRRNTYGEKNTCIADFA